VLRSSCRAARRAELAGASHCRRLGDDRGRNVRAEHTVLSIATRPGVGPRYLAFHPNGRFHYLLNQADSAISTYQIEPGAGTLAKIEMITTLPTHFLGEANAAGIHLTPDGR
jgi:6-phosphogluconolactonase (cycloisomerase 2 family)